MNRKQALIVDDSRTAQYLLKRMLEKYDLRIDIASSAEEALAYLSYNHPAIIFLDQQMTGMTGFEALKTIKANPHTALIPVIMYSAQHDDLFISQAIALGAQGFLSKSAMHPANLQQVLERLNIRKLAGEMAVADEPVQSPADAGPEPAMEGAAASERRDPAAIDPGKVELDKVRMQVGRLFELHVTDLKNHVNNSTQFVLKRLSTTIDKSASRQAELSGNAMASMKSIVNAAIAAERRKGVLANRVLLMVMIAMVAAFAYFMLQAQADAEASSKRMLALLETKNTDRAMMTAVSLTGALPARTAEPGEPSQAIHPALLQAVSWAQRADFHFDYGEAPLDGARLSNLQRLVQLLADGGYRGPLVISINFGNFCLDQDDAGTLRLARSDVRLSSCKMQKDLVPRFNVNDYITLQYQAFEKNVPAIRDGRISLRVVTNGMSTPVADYPLVTPQSTAGEWNRAALRNNRIAVLIPE